jgi:hypothetical protein
MPPQSETLVKEREEVQLSVPIENGREITTRSNRQSRLPTKYNDFVMH